MRKTFIIINGTMGVGKTTTCQLLYERLQPSVWLDGDWCWKLSPFVASEENKRMAEGNMAYLLQSFFKNTSIKYVIFSWVIHTEDIMDMVVNWAKDFEVNLYSFTLMCSKEQLKERLMKDIHNDVREEGILEKSLERWGLFERLNSSTKIDTSHCKPADTAEKIVQIILDENKKSHS